MVCSACLRNPPPEEQPFADTVFGNAPCIFENGIVGNQHHQYQYNGVDQHPVIINRPEQLWQNGQHCGSNDTAPNIAHTTQHHEYQYQNGGVETNFLGTMAE